jgi:hypothetical protein
MPDSVACSAVIGRAAAYASRAGIFAVLLVAVLAIFGARHLVRHIASQSSARANNDLIRSNLKAPSAPISGSLESNMSTKAVTQRDAVQDAVTLINTQ